jgi:hypothetical protein
MKKALEIQMEVEKLDSQENVIVSEVNVRATYLKDKGDDLTPPYEEMEIDSVTLEDGTDYELDSYEEKTAIALLYEEARAMGE